MSAPQQRWGVLFDLNAGRFTAGFGRCLFLQMIDPVVNQRADRFQKLDFGLIHMLVKRTVAQQGFLHILKKGSHRALACVGLMFGFGHDRLL